MPLELHLVTPEREVWTGEATMVVARGTEGEVGILPGHAPMLVELAIGPLTIVQGERREHAAVDGGFLHVQGDRVDVLAEQAELESEIDVARVQARREELERRLGETEDAEARTELAKTLTRLSLGR